MDSEAIEILKFLDTILMSVPLTRDVQFKVINNLKWLEAKFTAKTDDSAPKT